MKCTMCDCTADLAADALFCEECGHPASAHVAAAPLPTTAATTPPPPTPATVVPPPAGTQPAPHAPTQAGSYGAAISRQQPGLLVFLVDRSGSMDEPIGGGSGQKKKQVEADAINRLIYNTVLRCAKEDGVRPYFDVGVWGYGGNGEVQRAFGADLLSITQIADRPLRTETRHRRVPDGAGGVYEEEFNLPIWFEPAAQGTTPMEAAFRAAAGPVRDWLARHANSFPPIVLNLTDGAYSDHSPAPVVWELMGLGTSDGNVLVFNCHISKEAGESVTFPADPQAAGLQGLARELYDMSSALPEPMRRQGEAKGYTIGPGGRGYAFNADLVTMIDFLDIGTRVAQDRTE